MPECPVMIDLGEAQILEWQVPQALERSIHTNRACAHPFKQLSQMFLIHTAFRLSE